MTGFLQVSEWGILETPVYLTATMAVGRVHDGAVAAAADADPAVGNDAVVIRGRRRVRRQLAQRRGAGAGGGRRRRGGAGGHRGGRSGHGRRGNGPRRPRGAGRPGRGRGTGMVCFDWNGGIGTSSRAVAELGATVGVLVLANFGAWSELRVDGVPVGRALGPPREARSSAAPPAGSCIVLVATDAPLGSAQLERLARRAGLGLAWTGSVADHGSGEIFLAFAAGADSGGRPPARGLPGSELDALIACAVEATEEAVLNALCFARDTDGREGRLVRALPHDDVLDVLAAHGRPER